MLRDKEEIKKVCQKVVLEQDIFKLRNEAQQQLDLAKQQLVFWDTKIKEHIGTVAGYNLILQKMQTPKSLVLQDDHKPDRKKNEQPK